MDDVRGPTIEQLRTFAAVADAGSFTIAAERLGRAQSVVSYSVAALEAALGVSLFERARRRPVLTEAGHALLSDARRVETMMRDMQARAAGIRQGLEAEVSLAVDVMYPIDALTTTLEDFAEAFPTVALSLRIEALGGVRQLVGEGSCTFGISGPSLGWADTFVPRGIGSFLMIAVCARKHPLATLGGPIPTAVLREHTQLVLTDRSRLTEGQNFGVYAARSWRIGDLGAKHRLLLAGLGWGNMPPHMVEDDLAAGRLVRLLPADRPAFRYNFTLIHRADSPLGPASRWLAERITAASAALPGSTGSE
ncbi:LysR family transcriptional regulator [Chitinasiproducens palmae]|uniref:DNA-binding transcriptional regulator, LysR family n=1 Tax=Chitinasiproducens palmae TaxID=1770053 RepID=A0A1H2PQ33_9BURK|nr:LysR family transcriptional regulator [Chitinasiproducens palmae]SDV48463.1 DNA-binding transcriptional regulator, LysR family [Chitinasiproducens palmae]